MGIYGTGYTGTESPVSRSTTAKERDYSYSDLDFVFQPSPLYRMQGLSGDVVRKFDTEAIKQSVKNIPGGQYCEYASQCKSGLCQDWLCKKKTRKL